MSYYSWQLAGNVASLTSITRSFSYRLGRKSPDDITATTIADVVLINNAESTFPVTIGNTVSIVFRIGNGDYAEIAGRVDRMTYDDQPGTGNNSSITISLLNALGLSSQEQVVGASIGAGTISAQITSLNGYTTLDTNYLPGSTASTYNMAAVSYTGSGPDYLRALANADAAIIESHNYTDINYYSYQQGFVITPVSFGRTASSTVIGYQDVRRTKFEHPFYNQVTVSSSAVASQTAINATSVTNYGKKAYNLNTYYSTTSQAADAASWYANAWSTEQFSFEIDFLVDAQTSTVWTQTATGTTAGKSDTSSFATLIFQAVPTLINVSYRAPGASSDTTVPCVLQGIAVSATPNATIATAYLTPAQCFSRFILNNAYFGILNTDRLGW